MIYSLLQHLHLPVDKCSAFNCCATELFVSNFDSFQATIANTISSFKWRENMFI